MDIRLHALSKREVGLANCIKTPVVLTNELENKSVETLAIWDTGATNSVITKSAAAELGLIPISKAVVNGVHGYKEVNVYYLKITLNNQEITLKSQVTECEELSQDNSTRFLIGMNIINLGDFSITNHQGNTIMSFRVPSLKAIDFVSDLETYNRYQKIGEIQYKKGIKKCPCGSNKDFKNCHAKPFSV